MADTGTDTIRLRIVLAIILVPAIIGGMFVLAGRLDWVRGWGFVLVVVAGNAGNDLYLWKNNPELLLARARGGKGTKNWDKICLALFGTFYVATLIVGAIDAGRYNPSAMPASFWIVGAIAYLLSIVVLAWSMKVNPFFEKTARIQSDRGHRVVDAGPYKYVRHPGYTATIIGYIPGTPLMLGSWWAFVPAILALLVMVVRTALEDRMLLEELAGYAAYASRVRYRLMPGLW